MATLEQGLELQDSKLKRSLSPGTSERIIIRLTSVSPEPLDTKQAREFSHALRRVQRGPADYVLALVTEELPKNASPGTKAPASFYLDFNATPDHDPRSTLRHAVQLIGSAALDTLSPTRIVGAWAVPEHTDPVQLLVRSDGLNDMPELTQSAIEMYDRHQDELISKKLTYFDYAA